MLVLALLIASGIFARSTTQAQSPVVNGDRCSLAQGELAGTVKTHDLKTRVYRVQAYQYIHRRLDIFTARLEHNNQPNAKELRTYTDRLDKSISDLVTDYEKYDSAREDIAAMKDCRQHPSDFQRKLDNMRSKRQKINDDVVSIDGLLGTSIRSNISDVYSQLLATGTSGARNE